MGGRGSGRCSSYSGKAETSDSMPLDIRKITRKSLLVPGNGFRATLNKPSKISAQTWMTQFFGLLCLSRGPFGQFAGR